MSKKPKREICYRKIKWKIYSEYIYGLLDSIHSSENKKSEKHLPENQKSEGQLPKSYAPNRITLEFLKIRFKLRIL